MASRKSRLLYNERSDSDEDVDDTRNSIEADNSSSSKPGTLFEFFKKKTRFNLNKSLKANMESKKVVTSITDTDRDRIEQSNNLSFLKKLKDTISPSKPFKNPMHSQLLTGGANSHHRDNSNHASLATSQIQDGHYNNNNNSNASNNLKYSAYIRDDSRANQSVDDGLSSINTSVTGKREDRRYASVMEREPPRDDYAMNSSSVLRSAKKGSSISGDRMRNSRVQFASELRSETRTLDGTESTITPTNRMTLQQNSSTNQPHQHEEILQIYDAYENSTRQQQIHNIQRKMISQVGFVDEFLKDIKQASEKCKNKIDRMLKFIENNDYFECLTLKNMAGDSKMANLGLQKCLQNLNIDIPPVEIMLNELDEMYKKEKQIQIDDVSQTVRHTFCLERKTYETKIAELQAEVESLKHDVKIYNQNIKEPRKKEITAELQRRNYEVEELCNKNMLLETTLARLEKENSFLKQNVEDNQKHVNKFQDRYNRESEDLRREAEAFKKESNAIKMDNQILQQELTKALKQVAEDKEEIERLKNDKISSALNSEKDRSQTPLGERSLNSSKYHPQSTNSSFHPHHNRSDSYVKENSKRSSVDDKPKRLLKMTTNSLEEVKSLKNEVKEMKYERKVLVSENERLLQRVTDQLMLERDLKKVTEKNEELSRLYKSKKLENDCLWKTIKEVKTKHMKSAKGSELVTILRKFNLEERAKSKIGVIHLSSQAG